MGSKRIFAVGNRYLLAYLAFLSAFAPLSTDMYLPALPSMVESFSTTGDVISLTISSFMLVFAFSMLIWGPLGDRYGRRPTLAVGSAIFIISSVSIALCHSVAMLLLWRCVQAFGAGAASCVALAVVKDLLRGSMMEKVVSWMQAAMILAPMLAPVLGGWMLLLVDWRGIFWLLALCGLISLLGVLALKETSPCDAKSSIGASFMRIRHVLANRSFTEAMILFSATCMPFMSYLALSSFVFQNQFGLSAQAYSLFFAFNATVSLGAPIAHLWIFRHLPRKEVILWQLFAMCAAAVAIVVFGGHGPWIFALLFAPLTFCGGALRAPSTVLMMEIIKGDNGVVTSLINWGHLLAGSLAMFIAAIPIWPTPALGIGCISLIFSIICWRWWLLIKNNY